MKTEYRYAKGTALSVAGMIDKATRSVDNMGLCVRDRQWIWAGRHQESASVFIEILETHLTGNIGSSYRGEMECKINSQQSCHEGDVRRRLDIIIAYAIREKHLPKGFKPYSLL